MADEAKAVALEDQVLGMRAAVMDDDLPRVDRAAADVERTCSARLGENLHTVIDEIVERRIDRRNGFRRRALFEDLIHCQLLRTSCIYNEFSQHKPAAELR